MRLRPDADYRWYEVSYKRNALVRGHIVGPFDIPRREEAGRVRRDDMPGTSRPMAGEYVRLLHAECAILAVLIEELVEVHEPVRQVRASTAAIVCNVVA